MDPFAADPKFKTSKIFVGGLPNDLNLEGLRDYFMNFGEVVDCVIVSDKDTKQSRCFGFVQFTTCQAVEEVMRRYYEIIINGKWVRLVFLPGEPVLCVLALHCTACCILDSLSSS